MANLLMIRQYRYKILPYIRKSIVNAENEHNTGFILQ